MDIGINSNLWPEETHREEMPRILAEMAQAGYAGIEIGIHRVVDLYSPEVFLGMCGQEGLQVSGIHTPLQRYDEGDLDYAKRAADYSQAAGNEIHAGQRTGRHRQISRSIQSYS